MKQENPEVPAVEETVANEALVPNEDVINGWKYISADSTGENLHAVDSNDKEYTSSDFGANFDPVEEFDIALEPVVESNKYPLTLAFDDGTILTATFLQNEEYLNFLYTNNPVEYTKVMASGHSASPVSYPFTS